MGYAYNPKHPARRFENPRKRLPLPDLTQGQRVLVNGLLNGETPREMAYRLGKSRQWVHWSLRNACLRNGLRTREQLAAWWAVKQFAGMQNGMAA